MGGGLAGGKAEHRLMKITELAPCAEKMQKYTRNIATTVPIVARRWTEVTAIAIWHEQEQMMDIGG